MCQTAITGWLESINFWSCRLISLKSLVSNTWNDTSGKQPYGTRKVMWHCVCVYWCLRTVLLCWRTCSLHQRQHHNCIACLALWKAVARYPPIIDVVHTSTFMHTAHGAVENDMHKCERTALEPQSAVRWLFSMNIAGVSATKLYYWMWTFCTLRYIDADQVHARQLRIYDHTEGCNMTFEQLKSIQSPKAIPIITARTRAWSKTNL